LVCDGRKTLHGDGLYFVVVDGSNFEVGSCIIRALEVLYKVYHVFSLKYSTELMNVFNFFDLYVFKFIKAKPSGSLEKYFKSLKN
jgi:hypothetical protein